jgi:hypothetical protein
VRPQPIPGRLRIEFDEYERWRRTPRRKGLRGGVHVADPGEAPHPRHILRDGDTAVLELHQTQGHFDWTVILNRTSQGWRAVDIIPTRPLP